jgi:hypothetical protein
MKTSKNSSFFAYSLLSIALGMTLTVTILSVILPIVFSISRTEMPTWFDLMVRLEPISKSTSSLVNNNYLIGDIRGRLTILNQTTLLMILNNLVPTLIFGSWTYGIFLLRKIIKNVHEGNHFVSSNVKNMRIIALIMMIVPHIQVLLQNIFVNSLPQNLIIDGMKVSRVLAGPINIFNFSLIPDYILLGLIIFVFAEVFKEGENLKQENDLTV